MNIIKNKTKKSYKFYLEKMNIKINDLSQTVANKTILIEIKAASYLFLYNKILLSPNNLIFFLLLSTKGTLLAVLFSLGP